VTRTSTVVSNFSTYSTVPIPSLRHRKSFVPLETKHNGLSGTAKLFLTNGCGKLGYRIYRGPPRRDRRALLKTDDSCQTILMIALVLFTSAYLQSPLILDNLIKISHLFCSWTRYAMYPRRYMMSGCHTRATIFYTRIIIGTWRALVDPSEIT